jgi:hypothetical protein
MKRNLILLSAILFLGMGCLWGGEPTVPEDPTVLIDHDAILLEAKEKGLIMNDEEVASMVNSVRTDAGIIEIIDADSLINQDFSGWGTAALADVTGGGSYGLAYANYQDGIYTLVSRMGELPALADGYQYEGWIVRRSEDFSAINIGPVMHTEEHLVSVYQSTTDLSDHDFFVLTLEPLDENPAPAEHILEGRIK